MSPLFFSVQGAVLAEQDTRSNSSALQTPCGHNPSHRHVRFGSKADMAVHQAMSALCQ